MGSWIWKTILLSANPWLPVFSGKKQGFPCIDRLCKTNANAWKSFIYKLLTVFKAKLKESVDL